MVTGGSCHLEYSERSPQSRSSTKALTDLIAVRRGTFAYAQDDIRADKEAEETDRTGFDGVRCQAHGKV